MKSQRFEIQDESGQTWYYGIDKINGYFLLNEDATESYVMYRPIGDEKQITKNEIIKKLMDLKVKAGHINCVILDLTFTE